MQFTPPERWHSYTQNAFSLLRKNQQDVTINTWDANDGHRLVPICYSETCYLVAVTMLGIVCRRADFSTVIDWNTISGQTVGLDV